MSVWIIAFNVDGNTHMLKVESGQAPDLDEAVDLVTRKAEETMEEQEFEPAPTEEQTPAMLLYERFGITITGISEL